MELCTTHLLAPACFRILVANIWMIPRHHCKIIVWGFSSQSIRIIFPNHESLPFGNLGRKTHGYFIKPVQISFSFGILAAKHLNDFPKSWTSNLLRTLVTKHLHAFPKIMEMTFLRTVVANIWMTFPNREDSGAPENSQPRFLYPRHPVHNLYSNCTTCYTNL